MKHYQQNLNFQLKNLSQKFLKVSQNREYCLFTKEELIQLVDYFEFENLPENALEVVEYGNHFFNNSPSFTVRKTRLLLYHYNYQLAIKFLDEKQSKSLNRSQHHLLDLEILIVEQKFNEAIDKVDELKRFYSKTGKILSDVFYLESSIYERLNNYEKSFESISEALRINYLHNDALGKLWMVTELSRKWEESVLLHEYLLKREHYSAMTWFNLGHAYYGLCEYDKAIEAFGWCIKIDEFFESAYSDIAEVLEVKQRYTEAANFLYNAILKFNRDEVDEYLKCSECYVKAGQYENAIQILEGVVESFEDPDLWFWLGEANRLKNNFEASIVNYNNALAVCDFRDDIHSSLGMSHFYLANYIEAQAHLEKAIEYAPHEVNYRTILASILLNINELQKGEQVLYEAVEEIPNVSLQYQLAAMLIVNGKRKKGLKTLEGALQMEPNLITEFFDFAPELDQNDNKINLMIKYYYPNWIRS